TLDFKNVGDHIFLIGASANDIASSQYLVHVHGVANSPAPQFDLEEEYNVQQVVKDIIAQQLVQSVHDVSDGGLFISLIESAMHRNLGFDIMTDEEIRKDAFLFGESQSRIVVTVNEEQLDDFLNAVTAMDVEFTNIGQVTSGAILIDQESFGVVSDYKTLYNTSIENELAHS